MRDVFPPEQHDIRSIRDIPVSQSRRAPLMGTQGIHPSGGRRRGGSIVVRLLLLIVAAVAAGVAVASFFHSATVSVHVRQAVITLPVILQARLNSSEESLSFQQVSASHQAQRTVVAAGTTAVTTSAEGTMTIFNTANSAPQTLIANTRFEAPDGKIYRIHKTVSVPGITKKSGGVITPGTVQVTVYADKAGPAYNRGATRFTIPGFKGTPRFDVFYAQSDSISGGFSGTRPTVSQSDLQKAQAEIKLEMASTLATSSAFAIPGDSLPINGTLDMEFGELKVADTGNGQAVVTQNATSTELIVKETDLATALAKLQVPEYKGDAVAFSDNSAVVLSLSTSSTYTHQASSVSFSVSGSATLLWNFDQYKIKQDLAGKNKSSFISIIEGFAPAITKADVSLVPLWKTTFPADPAKIKIEVVSE